MENTTALVTGATSGIGAAIARTLAGAGARVVVAGRDAGRGATVVEEIRTAGGDATFLPVDLAGPPAAVRAAVAPLGPVDLLVNNAGVYPVGPTEALSDADVDRLLGVNVRAPHVLVAALAPAMADRGAGTVVTIGSWMASTGTAGAALYSATKAAAEHLTRCWSAEYGPRGVRVVTVAPGVTLTPGNEAARPVLDAMVAGTPAGRLVRPDDVARGVLFAVGPDAALVHGSTLYVDGGITAVRPG
jgi:NAD(P)-dependent dehydrogenase (short-subunit alcohol dehydrogenase family)